MGGSEGLKDNDLTCITSGLTNQHAREWNKVTNTLPQNFLGISSK